MYCAIAFALQRDETVAPEGSLSTFNVLLFISHIYHRLARNVQVGIPILLATRTHYVKLYYAVVSHETKASTSTHPTLHIC